MPEHDGLDRVLAFLPYFEDDTRKKYDISGSSVAGPYVYAEETVQFLQVLHDEGVILDFDYAAWREEALRYLTKRELIDTADLEILFKLFTTIVGAEKVTTGVVAEMMDKGVIAQLLQRMGEIRSAYGN